MSTKVVLGVILVLCAFLRFYQLDGYGLWSDEFVTLMIVSASSYSELIKTCFEVPQPMPPLYFLLSKIVFDGFSPGETSLRLVSAFFSFLTGYLLFALGRELFNAEIGLWASLLFSVNSTQIVYAQNARPYALCLLLSAASILSFVKWLRNRSWRSRLTYVAATTLLFYSHYVFFSLLLIQNLYFAWSGSRLKARQAPLRRWKEWLLLQAMVAVSLLPLASQMWHVLRARHSLNWESKVPRTAEDFFVFWNPSALGWGISAGALLSLVGFSWMRFRKNRPKSDIRPQPTRGKFIFLGLWYFVPVTVFYLLLQLAGINLFVERYLMLASLATFLILPAAARIFASAWTGRGALLIYCLSYIWLVPASLFLSNGQFSQGVPGGNEWRETLTQLGDAGFKADLLLFQSPFIESNKLDFAEAPKLRDYLSSPLRSFYAKQPPRRFVLLPVHWWINTPNHLRFKAEVYSELKNTEDFVLLSTQEFWEHFEFWLQSQAAQECGWVVTRRFQSSGSLRLLHLSQIRREPGCSVAVRQRGTTYEKIISCSADMARTCTKIEC